MSKTFELTEEQASFSARHLLRSENIGTLATNFHNASSDHVSLSFDIGTDEKKEVKDKLEGPEGWPYCVFDYYVDLPEAKGDPIFLMSTIQNTVTNINNDQRACFTVRTSAPYTPYSGRKPTPMTCGRVALFGKVELIDSQVDSELIAAARSGFLKCHPDAGWINFKDFQFYRLRVEKIYWVGGFGSSHYIGWVHDNLYTQVPESSLPSQRIGYESIQGNQTGSLGSDLVISLSNEFDKFTLSKFIGYCYSSQRPLVFRVIIYLMTLYYAYLFICNLVMYVKYHF